MATLNANCPVSADDLREILDTGLTDVQLNAFLNAAYYRTRQLSGNLAECGGADAEAEIIKYLAAHLASTREPQARSQKWEGYSVQYTGKDGAGLEATPYGQAALSLDCSGNLARAGLKMASFQVVSYEDLEEVEPGDTYYD